VKTEVSKSILLKENNRYLNACYMSDDTSKCK